MKSQTPSSGQLLSLIVGSPGRAADLCEDPRHAPRLALLALGMILVGSGAFGALLGWTRSPLQAVFAAIKLPVAWLLTLVVCVPAYYAVSAVFGAPQRLRLLCSGVLVAMARASSVLLGLLPVLWLAHCVAGDDPRDYHRIIAVAVVLFAGSGLAALAVLRPLLARKPVLVAAAVGLFLLVGGQCTWTLRPFVGRPADTDVPFLRSPEDTFLQVLPRALRSAGGEYERVAPHASRAGGSR